LNAALPISGAIFKGRVLKEQDLEGTEKEDAHKGKMKRN